MEWWLILAIAGGLLLALFSAGMPIFLAFLSINVLGVLVFLGPNAFGMVVNSVFDTTTTGTLTAIPLFVLMGEILFRSGSTTVLFDAVDRLVGHYLRGRQYVLAMALATVFGALSGSNMAVAAMMGRTVYPGMIARGYDARLSIGVILGGASLAPVIPPSVLAIIIATLANVSVAGLLIAGILPGLLLSGMFLLYALGRCALNPALAPDAGDEPATGGRDALPGWVHLVRCLPFALIIASVMGFILTGVATPSESAATGVCGALATALVFRRLSWRLLWESLGQSAYIASMILVIMASSTMFSQLLAFTGATGQLTGMVAASDLSPAVMFLLMMALVFVFCMFIDQVALMLIVIPIYEPMVGALGFDPIWFWLLMLLNVTLGGITPPFGYAMFAFKAVAPETDLRTVFRATWPFVALFILGMAIIYAVPEIATLLPGLL